VKNLEVTIDSIPEKDPHEHFGQRMVGCRTVLDVAEEN
jgi:hypothetical protein